MNQHTKRYYGMAAPGSTGPHPDQLTEEVEAKAKEIYLAKYGAIGGRWELVETKDVWRQKVRDWIACDEGTRDQRS